MAKENAAITDADRDRLTDAFSRGFTTAYLDGKRGNDIMSYQRPNNRGLFLGRVDEVRDGAAYLKSAHALTEGDVLEFWTRKGNGTLTLGPVRTDKKGRYHLPLEGKTRTVKAGDRVFRVRSAEAAFEDDAREPRVPLVGTATLHIGEPLRMEFHPAAEADIEGAPRTTLAVARRLQAAFPDGVSGVAEGAPVEAARTRAVSFDDVAAHIDRLGNTPYQLVNLTIDMDDGVGIGFSALHGVRAAALDVLTEALTAEGHGRTLPRTTPREPLPAARPTGCRVAVTVTNPACARAAKRAGAHLIYVPALNYRRGEAVIAGQKNAAAEQAGYPEGLHSHHACGRSRGRWRRARSGRRCRRVEVCCRGQAASGRKPRCYWNGLPKRGRCSMSAPMCPLPTGSRWLSLAEFGAARVWLSPELTLRQIEEVAKDAPVELGVLSSAPRNSWSPSTACS